MTVANNLSDIRIVNNIIEVHCVEQLDDGRIIGHWRTTLQAGADISILDCHCTEEEKAKVQAHLELLTPIEATDE